MNKLTKVGCSALCGSLAAISAANAGDLAVTGGAHMTYMSSGAATTGNPIGMASAVTFSGTGELDNGWTFGFYTDFLDKDVYSASRINITMGGLGTIEFDQGNSGNGIAAYDNVLPTAWEEAHGAGLSGGVKTVLGAGASDNIQYSSPVIAPGMIGAEFAITYAKDYGSADTADKTNSATEDVYDEAKDITFKVNPSLGTEILSGLNIYGGASEISVHGNGNVENNLLQGVAAVTYALGPIEVGAMWSGLYDGNEDTTVTYHSYKNHGYGIAFNVNDDLSASYGKYTSRKAGYANSNQSVGEGDRVAEVTSWQVAYTMGGASLRVADVKADNVLFNKDDDQEATIVSLGLAF
jgi:outer membrane protein OmpU